MTTGQVAQRSGTYVDRPSPSGLADVVDLILDKGLVIDVYVRVALVGIELLTIDARIVVASVDTYLRFAEAVNRLDIEHQSKKESLPDLIEGVQSGGARSKAKGAMDAAEEKVRQTLGKGDKSKSRPAKGDES